ncbi:MAG: glycosyltransferase family 39 protein [Candidatus Omnitrophica bacterium]|nr:glycosyltransferase family 39 protein [Candidatus Omnitrophota bacterium]
MYSFLFALILVYSFLTKIWGLSRPFLGNFASYQLMTVDVAKFILMKGPSAVFLPMTFCSASGEPGLILLNFWAPAVVAATLFKLFGVSIVFWGRFQMVVFAVLATWVLYLFVKERWGERVALWSAFIFNLSPLTTIYGQSFMNDMPALFLTLLAFYLAGKSGQKDFAAGIVTGILITLRIHLGVLLLPLGFLAKKNRLWFLLPAVLTPLAWYGWIYWVTRHSDNVFMSMFPQIEMYGQGSPFHLFMTLGFYKQIIYYFVRYLLTPIGVIILPFALWNSWKKKEDKVLWLWLLALAVSMVVLPRKYHDHNFYLWHWIAPLAIILGGYFDGVFEKTKKFRPVWICLGFTAIFLNSFLAFKPAFVTPRADEKIVPLSKAIQRMALPEDRIIVATHEARPEYIPLSERIGWPFELDSTREDLPLYFHFKSLNNLSDEERSQRDSAFRDPIRWIEYLKSKGAKYFFVVNPQDIQSKRALFEYLEKLPKSVDAETGLIRYKI